MTMYGTIARITPKPGMDQAVVASVEEWQRDRGPRVKGAIAGYVYRLDKGGLMMAAVFESKEAYVANSEDPAQDRWYQKFRALLETDPEWNDGEVVSIA
jgi:quinol monooxygenase YgiN